MYRVSAVEAETCLMFVALQCVVPRVCSEIKVGDCVVDKAKTLCLPPLLQPCVATQRRREDRVSTGD